MGNIELEVPRRRPIFLQTRYNQQASPQRQRAGAKAGRVTDFNDFLTEIKKHMHQQPSPTAEGESGSSSSEELVLRFRLEN